MSFFFPVRFKTYVQLAPAELTDDFEECILGKLRKTYEGVCSRYGFIKPTTLRLVQRSAGQLMKPHFNGYIRFEAIVVGEVCNPTKGTVVEAVVKAKNNLGLLAESSVDVAGEPLPILDIIVPKRSAGIASEVDLDDIAVRQKVFVEVMGKRYQLKDRKISIIGRVVTQMKTLADIMDDAYEGADGDGDINDDADEFDGGVGTEVDEEDDAVVDEDGEGTADEKPKVKVSREMIKAIEMGDPKAGTKEAKGGAGEAEEEEDADDDEDDYDSEGGGDDGDDDDEW
jgi:DNA-directed RNA polymerase subunit E'/Rpb7